jgi:hypothetical protein
MKYLSSLFIPLLLTIFFTKTHAQDKSWNLLLEKEVARFIGYQVYETDSFYIVIGTSIDSFGTYEQGFSISKVDKREGALVTTKHYEEQGVEFDFNQCRKGFMIENEIFFPQDINTKPYAIQLFKININTLEIKKILNIVPPDPKSNYGFFLKDFQLLNNHVFILAQYYIGEIDTPSLRAIQILISYNLFNSENNIIKFAEINEKIELLKISTINNNLISFGTIQGTQIATGKMTITYMDTVGNMIWQYETPGISPIHEVKDIYPINDQEVLLASYDSFFDYTNHNLYSRWTVTRYDVVNKKIVWSNHWDEPRNPNIWGTAKIIKTKKEGEYFLMANDIDSTFDGIGKIVKFNDKGQRLWQKTYDFTTNQGFNEFNNIIQTYDQNYLIVGSIFSVNLPQSAWLVKIDEDGNILPLDTTSAAIDTDVVNQIPEVKLYPNPASHTIIINQGEITNMTYQLVDISGAAVKSMPLPHAHHHVVWDISDVASGTYVLTMMQGGKLIGSKQQVVVK